MMQQRLLEIAGLLMVLAQTQNTAHGAQALPYPAISPTDIAFIGAPDKPLGNRRGHLQCMGGDKSLTELALPVTGPDDRGTAEMKHGWVPDPAEPSRSVAYFSIRATDPDTAGPGNKRCEYAYTGEGLWIPWDREFWFGVAVKTTNFAASTDQQSVWQWHEGSRTYGLSPYLAALVSGTRLSLQLRHNANDRFSQANTTVVKLFSSNKWQADTWNYFVVKTRLNSQNNESSQLIIWLNGTQVADYTGPLGYLYSPPKDYVKVGLYHWTNAGNEWSPGVPKREAWIKGPVLLLHSPGYDRQTIEALLR